MTFIPPPTPRTSLAFSCSPKQSLPSWQLSRSVRSKARAALSAVALAAGLFGLAGMAAAQSEYQERPDAIRLAEEIAQKRNLDATWARQMVGMAQNLPSVVKLMRPSSRPNVKNWNVYRGRFIEPVRINAGVRFWQQNRQTLARAEREYGVPAEIIVGILGVETIYGRDMGSFRVMDALATLALDYPPEHPRAVERGAYFRGELESFLSQHHGQGTDPFAQRGSYAGAMGMPQFMPSSWAKYAVDYDRDGRVDLAYSAADAIGSVANYFIGYGWKPGLPTHYPVNLTSSGMDKAELLAPDIRPTFTAATMAAKGANMPEYAAQHQGPLALIELPNGDNFPSYVVGTENFYTITRYNNSSSYALAVIELGQAVKAKMGL